MRSANLYCRIHTSAPSPCETAHRLALVFGNAVAHGKAQIKLRVRMPLSAVMRNQSPRGSLATPSPKTYAQLKYKLRLRMSLISRHAIQARRLALVFGNVSAPSGSMPSPNNIAPPHAPDQRPCATSAPPRDSDLWQRLRLFCMQHLNYFAPAHPPAPPHRRISCRDDVCGSDLTGSDLAGSDLAGSDLTGSDLAGSDLAGSDLAGSD